MLCCLLFLSLFELVRAYSVNIYPPYPVNGTSTTQFTVDGPFDAPKSNFYDETTWEWWYFDAVSDDLDQAIVIVFMINAIAATGSSAAPFNFIEFNVAFEDGTTKVVDLPSGSVILTTQGDGTYGIMNETGYSWFESSDLSFAYIDIDEKINNEAPHHAQCGPATKGASLEVVPHLGWHNAMPDATALINLNVNGKKLKFKGAGYHDSNYGDVSLIKDLGTWYWGHARVGPYSIVWYDTLDNQGIEHQSGYAAKDGNVLAESCGSMTVRPTGRNSTYPPIPGAPPSGFHIVYDMGHHGILDVKVTNHEVVEAAPPLYTRWIGKSVGGIRERKCTKASGSMSGWAIEIGKRQAPSPLSAFTQLPVSPVPSKPLPTSSPSTALQALILLAASDSIVNFEGDAPATPASIVDLHCCLKALEAAFDKPLAKQQKRMMKLQAAPDPAISPELLSSGNENPAKLKRQHLDANKIGIRTYLQSQVHNQLYAAMKYKLLQARAATLVLEQEKNHPNNVSVEYCEKWLTIPVVLKLACGTWPHLKQVWTAQRKEEEDSGKERRRKQSAGQRAEKQRMQCVEAGQMGGLLIIQHASQMHGVILNFCHEHNLEEQSV
ncbi:hypothetical protein DACRYDRAFT_100352 [Dacryopinax primogenitus]|uniref:AttH domain-containing protein n=1 Tax=Dacryopinax primogenitus (strain DJM 731) TaxID=1858805 RepID=M5GBL7_DACPD|nr:uncharacterized protein DACRYDRAFT_100352 [Dacryopinax primogenitus]EJU01403.1 hypothetical protein DACRYDRAFT_100352 [Dacryopinax primogenitus]